MKYFIKTGRSILKNIYPQVDGVPVYNPSGKYWIKLYFLGKARKIEIDDVFPFDGFSFRFLYPMAEYANMLWPLILTKALYKLFAFKWKYNNIKDEIGEGAVLYSLTGLLPCTFNLGNMNKGNS
jgi:Calpain family cysteine protease